MSKNRICLNSGIFVPLQGRVGLSEEHETSKVSSSKPLKIRSRSAHSQLRNPWSCFVVGFCKFSSISYFVGMVDNPPVEASHLNI